MKTGVECQGRSRRRSGSRVAQGPEHSRHAARYAQGQTAFISFISSSSPPRNEQTQSRHLPARLEPVFKSWGNLPHSKRLKGVNITLSSFPAQILRFQSPSSFISLAATLTRRLTFTQNLVVHLAPFSLFKLVAPYRNRPETLAHTSSDTHHVRGVY